MGGVVPAIKGMVNKLVEEDEEVQNAMQALMEARPTLLSPTGKCVKMMHPLLHGASLYELFENKEKFRYHVLRVLRIITESAKSGANSNDLFKGARRGL